MRNFKKVILGAALSMVCTVAFAQQLTVKGVVKQPDGETVIPDFVIAYPKNLH